jgi:peptide/nickel transport system ATP-binding protein/oligopeptide transport system ATP-binding protein
MRDDPAAPGRTARDDDPLLTADDVVKTYAGRRSVSAAVRRRPGPRLTAVDHVSLAIARHESVGLVGESGSGKTTFARCLIRLVEADAGAIRFDGVDVRAADARQLRDIRRRAQMVFQDPYTSLNPTFSVERTIAEPALVHGLVDRGGSPTLVANLLDRVGLPQTVRPRRPRELSGGQRQRVAIARALAASPELILADEAVSALDVSIQAQVLNLFEDLVRETGIAVLFISHQLAVIAHLTRRVAIMYLGAIVETGLTHEVFEQPRHPYTAALLSAHPSLETRGRRTPALRGELPSPYQIPAGCRFNTRCAFAEDRCFTEEPPLEEVAPGHRVACHVLPILNVD